MHLYLSHTGGTFLSSHLTIWHWGNIAQTVFLNPSFLPSCTSLPHLASNLAPIIHIQTASEGNFAETLPPGDRDLVFFFESPEDWL